VQKEGNLIKKFICITCVCILLVGAAIGLGGCLNRYENETPHQITERIRGVEVPKDAGVEFFHFVPGSGWQAPAYSEFFAIFRLQKNLTEEFLERNSLMENEKWFNFENRLVRYGVPPEFWPNWENEFLDNSIRNGMLFGPTIFYFPETLKLIIAG